MECLCKNLERWQQFVYIFESIFLVIKPHSKNISYLIKPYSFNVNSIKYWFKMYFYINLDLSVFYLVSPNIYLSLVLSSTCSYKILLHTYWNDFNNNSIFFFCKYIILWLQTTLFFCSHIFFDVGALHSYVFALYWSIPRSVVCRL